MSVPPWTRGRGFRRWRRRPATTRASTSRPAGPGGGQGLWIRHTVHKRPGAEPNASIWFVLFDRDADGPRATKVTVPAAELSTPAGSWIRVADAEIGPGRASGSIATDALKASWDLTFGGDAEPCKYLPADWLYEAPVPKTKFVAPYPGRPLQRPARDRRRRSDRARGVAGDDRPQLGHRARRALGLARGHRVRGRARAPTSTPARRGSSSAPGPAPGSRRGCSSSTARPTASAASARSARPRSRSRPASAPSSSPARTSSSAAASPPRTRTSSAGSTPTPTGPEHNTINCSVADLELTVERPAAAGPQPDPRGAAPPTSSGCARPTTASRSSPTRTAEPGRARRCPPPLADLGGDRPDRRLGGRSAASASSAASRSIALIAYTPYVAVAALLVGGRRARAPQLGGRRGRRPRPRLARRRDRAAGDRQRRRAPGPATSELGVLAANIHHGTADPDALVDLVDRRGVDLLSVEELTPSFAARAARAPASAPAPAARGPLDAPGRERRRPLLAASRCARLAGPAAPSTSGCRGRRWRFPAAARSGSSPSIPTRRTRAAPAAGAPASTPCRAPSRRRRPGSCAGDFNATLDHAELRRILDLGYRDAGDVTGNGLTPTWPEFGHAPAAGHDRPHPRRSAGSRSSTTRSRTSRGATTAPSSRGWRSRRA